MNSTVTAQVCGRRYIDDLAGLSGLRGTIVLYSGGTDSRYLVRQATAMGVRVVALQILLGAEDPDELANGAAAARRLGADYRAFDLSSDFADRFVAPAIRINAMYNGAYPVCSSLSRPLMAEAAIALAHREGIRCIAHSATWVQNSGSRFNNSLRALDPGLTIATPFAREPIDREAKLRALREVDAAPLRRGVYSVDANLWGRVIEAGVLDDPAHPIPDEVFEWTKPSSEAPQEATKRKLTFHDGLPVALDNIALPLKEIILRLNDVGGLYGVGRFNGLEDIPQGLGGVKNHEVREAPAAQSILLAQKHLEMATLTQGELEMKATVSREWTKLVVNGGWHTTQREAIDAMVRVLSRHVEGDVLLLYTPGSVMPTAINAPRALHYWNVRRSYERAIKGFPLATYLELQALRDDARADPPKEPWFA